MFFAKKNGLVVFAIGVALAGLVACNGSPAPSAASQPTAAAAATTVEATDPAVVTNTTSSAAPAAAVTKLNLNTATGDEFLTVPNVGQRMVREFMEYRPYTSIQQFRREIGKYVDDAQVAEYEKYVYVPVSPNNADAETLQQLPGVDATIADQLIAARPYASTEAFLAKLGELASADQAASAALMLEAE